MTHEIKIGGKVRPVSFSLKAFRLVPVLNMQNFLALLYDVTFAGLKVADKKGELPKGFDDAMFDEWFEELEPKDAQKLTTLLTDSMSEGFLSKLGGMEQPKKETKQG